MLHIKWAIRNLPKDKTQAIQPSKEFVANLCNDSEEAMKKFLKDSFWAKTIAWEKSKSIVLD